MNFNTKNTNNDLFAITSEKYMAGLGKTKTSISWDPHMEYDRIVSAYVLFMNSESIFLSQKLAAEILQSL